MSAPPAAVGGVSTVAEARRALYASAPFAAIVAAYVASGALVLRRTGHPLPYGLADTYETPAILAVTYLLVTGLLAIAIDVFARRNRPGDPETWRRLWRRWFGTRRLVGMAIVLLALPALLNVMIGFRLALTDFQPFTFDPLFMRWDAALHFGRHPWEWLHPLLGGPRATLVIDRAYVYGWFAMLWGAVVWQAVHGREPVRLQFFLAFSLSWIALGTLAAIGLSSAGPVYFGRVTGLEDPYAPLLAFLADVDARVTLHAVSNQGRLWESYRTWGGITAMPSMHLAISTVVSLSAVRAHRTLAWVVGPLWLLMLIGSVHLGWHYAIDSYAGALGGAAIWLVCGRFAAWWLARREAAGEPS